MLSRQVGMRRVSTAQASQQQDQCRQSMWCCQCRINAG